METMLYVFLVEGEVSMEHSVSMDEIILRKFTHYAIAPLMFSYENQKGAIDVVVEYYQRNERVIGVDVTKIELLGEAILQPGAINSSMFMMELN